MKLSVSTNWDFELIHKISEYPVYELLGAMDRTPVGGGRPANALPAPDSGKVEEYINEIHRNGMEFNYLLNSQCLGNSEYNKKRHQDILDHIEWLCKIEVDSVTVTIPYLIQIIKRQFPDLKIKASVIASINSVQKINFFNELGVDEINIDYMSNRDFTFLETIIKKNSSKYILLVNDLCLYQCPYRTYHYNSNSHASQNFNEINMFYIDYCIINCSLRFLQDPEQIIKSRWIRPEDIPIYEKMGYNHFKISGRSMSTSWLYRAVKAYSHKKYNGNLYDILASLNLQKNPVVNPYCYIDHKKLDGFLDFFRTRDCTNSCWQCNFCKETAEKSVTYNIKEAAHLKKFYSKLKNDMINSRYFK